LHDDARADVGHHAQGEDAGAGEGAAGEDAQQVHQAGAGAAAAPQAGAVHPGQGDEASDTVHQEETQRDEDAVAQLLDPPNVLYRFDEVLHPRASTSSVLPPLASMAALAVALKAWAFTSMASFSSPRPRIFTRSLREMSPCLRSTATSMVFSPVFSAMACKASRLMPLYSTRVGLLKPNLGRRRTKGVWPPSKPRR